MAAALYGPSGFYRTNSPAQHFRTSANAGPLLAASLVPLVVAVDESLGQPRRLEIVDVGAGDGRLLSALHQALPAELAGRTQVTAVELRPRPTGLPSDVGWLTAVPEQITGLVLANELLDNVPCDVARLFSGELRQVGVEPSTGLEELAGPLSVEQVEWVDRWWPVHDEGARVEIGTQRDQMWTDLVSHLHRGVALAVDYGHTRLDRASGAFDGGTLAGYRNGRQVQPLPDGSCDITAHVAMDACDDAGLAAGVDGSVLVRQGTALRALGLDARRPPIERAQTDPQTYVQQLGDASRAAELLDPTGLGSFWWLVQAKRCPGVLTGIDWSQIRGRSPW
jgi:SAM-dependent MidA family methyltransferase